VVRSENGRETQAENRREVRFIELIHNRDPYGAEQAVLSLFSFFSMLVKIVAIGALCVIECFALQKGIGGIAGYEIKKKRGGSV
jgi:hypothetical protein